MVKENCKIVCLLYFKEININEDRERKCINTGYFMKKVHSATCWIDRFIDKPKDR